MDHGLDEGVVGGRQGFLEFRYHLILVSHSDDFGYGCVGDTLSLGGLRHYSRWLPRGSQKEG